MVFNSDTNVYQNDFYITRIKSNNFFGRLTSVNLRQAKRAKHVEDLKADEYKRGPVEWCCVLLFLDHIKFSITQGLTV